MSPMPIDYWGNKYPAVTKPKTKLQKFIISTRLPKAIAFLDSWSGFGGWEPKHIFYTTWWKTDSYTVHQAHMEHSAFLGIGNSKIYKPGDEKYFSSEKKRFTPLGQWFEDAPGICQIAKAPYYIIMYPLTFILVLVRMLIVDLFLPKRKSDW